MYFIRRDRHEHPLKIVSIESRHVPIAWIGLVAVEHATREYAIGEWNNERFEFDSTEARLNGAATRVGATGHMEPHEMPGCFVFHREDAAD